MAPKKLWETNRTHRLPDVLAVCALLHCHFYHCLLLSQWPTVSVLSTSSETHKEKREQKLSRLACSSERQAPMFPHSYKLRKLLNAYPSRDTAVQRVTVPQCYTACWRREVSRAARLGLCNRVTVFGDAGWCPRRADLKALGGLHSQPCFFCCWRIDHKMDGWVNR